MAPLVQPILDRISAAIYSSPDVVVLGFVLVVLFLLVQVLNWMRRVVLFWTRLAFRAVFWALVVALAAFVWQRGIETSLRDLVVLSSKILGYAAVLKDVWFDEYQRLDAQTHAQTQTQAQGYGRGYGSGPSRGR